MFDHVKFGVSDYATSKAFFLKSLEPLGVTAGAEGEPSYGIELCGASNSSLCLFQAKDKPAPLHIAFVAGTREQVKAFYRAALEAAARTTANPVCAPTTMRTTMQPSSSVRTGTTSKRFVMRPRPNHSFKRTCLRQAA